MVFVRRVSTSRARRIDKEEALCRYASRFLSRGFLGYADSLFRHDQRLCASPSTAVETDTRVRQPQARAHAPPSRARRSHARYVTRATLQCCGHPLLSCPPPPLPVARADASVLRVTGVEEKESGSVFATSSRRRGACRPRAIARRHATRRVARCRLRRSDPARVTGREARAARARRPAGRFTRRREY